MVGLQMSGISSSQCYVSWHFVKKIKNIVVQLYSYGETCFNYTVHIA